MLALLWDIPERRAGDEHYVLMPIDKNVAVKVSQRLSSQKSINGNVTLKTRKVLTSISTFTQSVTHWRLSATCGHLASVRRRSKLRDIWDHWHTVMLTNLCSHPGGLSSPSPRYAVESLESPSFSELFMNIATTHRASPSMRPIANGPGRRASRFEARQSALEIPGRHRSTIFRSPSSISIVRFPSIVWEHSRAHEVRVACRRGDVGWRLQVAVLPCKRRIEVEKITVGSRYALNEASQHRRKCWRQGTG